MKKISIILFAILFIVSCSEDSENTEKNNTKKNTEIVKENSQTPENTIKSFIEDLGKKDYKSAYEKAKVKKWGDYEKFSSEKSFGSISGTEIKNIEQKPDKNGNAVINATVFYADPVNGDNTFEQVFELSKFSGEWKIVSVSLVKHKKVTFSKEEVEKEIQKFVLQNYKVFDFAIGDLNNDNIDDVILIQCEIVEDENCGDAVRPLLILVRDGNNKLSVKAKNNNVVYCCACGGIMGDPYAALEIENNTFTVSHFGGSSDRWSANFTFEYNTKNSDWELLKTVSETFSVHDPDNTSNITSKTKKDFGEVKFTDFDYENFL